TAYADLLADFKTTGGSTRRSISITVWPPTFNWLCTVWQLLREHSTVETTAQIITDALEVLVDVPPVAQPAEAAIRLVRRVIDQVPEARLQAADDAHLMDIFAEALDERDGETLSSLRGPEYSFT